MPTVRITYRIGHTWIFRQRNEAVVLPLLVRRSNRVNRWEIENVEAHGDDVGQPVNNVRKGSGFPGDAAG